MPPHISPYLPISPHTSPYFILAQGWLDLPEDDLHEKWVRRWFVLRNTVLNMFTEEQKEKSDLKQPIFALAVSDMRSAVRAKGVDFYKWGLLLEKSDGTVLTIGRYREMRGDMGRYGEIWGDMGRYGEMWGDMGRYREVTRSPVARLARLTLSGQG